MNKNNYDMIISRSGEYSPWVVEVPELPGCRAQGKTREEALKNAEDAIAFWIKTAKADAPKPKGRLPSA